MTLLLRQGDKHYLFLSKITEIIFLNLSNWHAHFLDTDVPSSILSYSIANLPFLHFLHNLP